MVDNDGIHRRLGMTPPRGALPLHCFNKWPPPRSTNLIPNSDMALTAAVASVPPVGDTIQTGECSAAWAEN
jgi:hypothetical protein